jgi:hypothetical protein
MSNGAEKASVGFTGAGANDCAETPAFLPPVRKVDILIIVPITEAVILIFEYRLRKFWRPRSPRYRNSLKRQIQRLVRRAAQDPSGS